jgi:hypothetical protein
MTWLEVYDRTSTDVFNVAPPMLYGAADLLM